MQSAARLYDCRCALSCHYSCAGVRRVAVFQTRLAQIPISLLLQLLADLAFSPVLPLCQGPCTCKKLHWNRTLREEKAPSFVRLCSLKQGSLHFSSAFPIRGSVCFPTVCIFIPVLHTVRTLLVEPNISSRYLDKS